MGIVEVDATPSASRQKSPSTSESVEDITLSPASSSASSVLTSATIELQESIEKLQVKEKKLCGAARKRLRWLLKQGLTLEEARAKATQPISEEEKRAKRPRSESTTPKGPDTKRAATERRSAPSGGNLPQGQKPTVASFKQVLEGKKMGIADSLFPEVNLTTAQMQAIQEVIISRIVDLSEGHEGDIKPKFLGTTFKAGWLVVNCENQETADWIKSVTPTLQPWEGASLMAIDEKELPRATIMNAYFPNSADEKSDRILKIVKGQNEGLNTNEWRVLKRTTEGSSAFLTLSVDHPSVENLKRTNYKVSYKFGQITLRQKSGKPTPQKEEPEPTPGTSGTAKDPKKGKGKVSSEKKGKGKTAAPKIAPAKQ
ncbi:uncharacterized protein [Onthophagus taurus]|uniref:uncharacterized protein n=1 Tax=Onthophagus taurus TaxID=166361 RepID=UPI0039BDACAE